MRTVGASAFWGYFQAYSNGAFKIKCGSRQECWDTGVTVGMSSNFWDSYNESTSRCILYEAGSGLGEIGNINLARTTTTRIRRHADYDHKNQDPKPRWQTNLRMLVYYFRYLCLRECLCLSTYLCARAYQCIGY